MHIPPFDNQNKPIVDVDDARVPLNYFNIVKLKKGEAFHYQVPGYETCIAPATGSVNVECEGLNWDDIGGRGVDVWDGEPEVSTFQPERKQQLHALVMQPKCSSPERGLTVF